MQGFETKGAYSRWLSENVKIPAGQFRKSDINYTFTLPIAEQGVEPYASWYKLPDDALIAPLQYSREYQYHRDRRRDQRLLENNGLYLFP